MKRPVLLSAVAAALLVIAPSSQAGIVSFQSHLDGTSEAPPNSSAGTGFAEVTIDDALNTMRVQVSFAGLTGNTTAAHIHCCTAVPGTGLAGVATVTPTFTGFPSGVTSGSYDRTFDLTLTSSFNPAFVAAHGGTAAGAEAFLIAGMSAGKSYLNLHSTAFPGGEIRGFLIPEPTVLSLLALALALGAGFVSRRRVRSG